ncbi:MAG: Cell division protein FtsX [Parcubacteria group bacterium ADurb.Bin316]|nr:MAG: Cell division protein FtsX [Parcubacteria group bacterium ADurb.Bin316]
MLISLLRVVKFSIQDIYRNIWLSLVTIMILILSLFTINMLLVVKVVGDTAVEAIKEKIDINLFLKTTAEENEILALKAKISNLSEVKDVTYISKTEALENFKNKHTDNPEVLEALKILGANPLSPTLVIKPRNLENFDSLINSLNAFEDQIIESRNFANYKVMLGKINSITEKVYDAGLVLSAIFIAITLLVIYNSARVTMYTHRREITIMRLVGASKKFIQMPYLLSSIIYTFIGVLIIMIVFYLFLRLLQPYLEAFFVGYNVNLINYFFDNSLKIFGTQFLVAAVINVLASYLAVRKYSKV